MSITIKQFRSGDFTNSRNTRKNHPVLIFLMKNKKAFRFNEICKVVKMKKETVRGMLGVLKKAKLVSHKSPYYIYTEHLKTK